MESQPDHRTALEAALLELDGAWTLLAGVHLGGTGADYLLLHPQHGAALVDLAPGRHDGVRTLRAFLEEQDFARFFAGNVPVVHLTLEPGAECALRRRLGVAFAASGPATIANPEWPQALAALVVAKQSREAWLGAPTPAAESAQSDASAAHFAAAAAAPGAAAREDGAWSAGEASDGAATAALENMRDLAPHMPRWQTVAAFASLAVFGMLYLALPGEAPRAPPPATVEVAIAPAAPQGGSGSPPPPPAIAVGQPKAAPSAVPHETPPPPAAPAPTTAAVPPAPPHAAAATTVTVAAMPPAQAPAPAPLPSVAAAAPPAKSAAASPRHPAETKEAHKAAPRRAPRVAASHAPADELAVNTLPPLPPPRPEPPQAAAASAPLADLPAHEPRAEPTARPVQPVADLIHRNCRVYSSRVTVLGAPAEVRGFACQAADGSWEIMSEAPATAH